MCCGDYFSLAQVQLHLLLQSLSPLIENRTNKNYTKVPIWENVAVFPGKVAQRKLFCQLLYRHLIPSSDDSMGGWEAKDRELKPMIFSQWWYIIDTAPVTRPCRFSLNPSILDNKTMGSISLECSFSSPLHNHDGAQRVKGAAAKKFSHFWKWPDRYNPISSPVLIILIINRRDTSHIFAHIFGMYFLSS